MKKRDLLSIYIIINILIIFTFCFIKATFKTPQSYLAKDILVFSILNTIISIILLIIKIRKKEYKLRFYDLLIPIIIILLIISTIFAKNIDVSLFGFPRRYEGLFSLVYYLTLLFLSSFVDSNKKKNIINVIIGTGVFQALYGLTHIYTTYNGTMWVNGLTTNPNFFGTYMLISLSCAIGMFILDNKTKLNIIYGIAFSILLIGLLISNTTSCLLGLIVVFIYTFIYLVRKKKYEKLIMLLIITIFTSVCVFVFDGTTLFNDLIKTNKEAIEISKGNINNSYGTGRVAVWKKTMEIVPKNIIHGVGIDNFYFAFDKGPIIMKWYVYDKVHNEYLQILICEGIFTLISYLLLYTVIILKGIKTTYKKDELYLILPVIGYLIQAFFNISVIEVAPIFFILLGLCIDRKNDINIYRTYIKRLLDIVFSIILLIIFLPLFIIISISIKLIDKNNIFYKQLRTGKNGKLFNIYKFKTIKDKKITKVGNILRRTSLDELPQLINILKNDMSFVGPRPWINDYYKLFNKKQKKRVDVLPGITGLAQVNGRNSISIFKKIDYDLEYVQKYSFIMDLKIILKSIKVLFNNENINIDKNIKKELNDLKKRNSFIEK